MKGIEGNENPYSIKRKKFEFIGWVAPSQCISLSSWFEWKALEGKHIFNRLLGFEWRTKR